jgi:hypothetical protein
VPGVLLADVHAAPNCALVAHDGGVPVALLIEAAARAGVKATIPPSVHDADPLIPRNALRLRSLLTIVLVVSFSLAFTNVMSRLNPANHWLAFIMLFSMCMLVSIVAVAGRPVR